MTTPKLPSLRNAGWWRFVVVVVLLAIGAAGKAQVVNDDCENAMPVVLWQSIHCALPGFAEANYWEGDSTHNALINFPYPSNPNPCSGYSSTMGALGRDVWFHPLGWANTYDWEMTCSDTCHVSWWVGECNTLAPLECYTLLPNTPTYMQVDLAPQVESNQFLLQVVANNPAVDIYFDACWSYDPVIVGGIPFMHTNPTPLTCLQDSISLIEPSGPDVEDGSIGISILQGNPPYAILWDDGSTEFIRPSLGAGAYGYSITDDVGCITSDTLILDLPTQLGAEMQRFHPFRWSCDAISGEFLLTPTAELKPCDLTLVDAMGRTLLEGPVPTSGLHLPYWMSSGPRVAILRFQNGTVLRTKVPVCITY